MWLFRKKQTLEESGFFRGFTDWHCHLLPDVDDGVQTMEETLQVLAAYERLGVKEVWLTPHIMEDMPNTPDDLRERFRQLQEVYTGNVTLHLASENMLDALFEERLQADELLPIGTHKDHLLVETSYFNPPLHLMELLDGIRAKRYYPLLAHPERYLYMADTDYVQLKEKGVKFQLNLPSLFGLYGKDIQERAKKLLKNRMYEYVGTDLHRIDSFQTLLQNKTPCLLIQK